MLSLLLTFSFWVVCPVRKSSYPVCRNTIVLPTSCFLSSSPLQQKCNSVNGKEWHLTKLTSQLRSPSALMKWALVIVQFYFINLFLLVLFVYFCTDGSVSWLYSCLWLGWNSAESKKSCIVFRSWQRTQHVFLPIFVGLGALLQASVPSCARQRCPSYCRTTFHLSTALRKSRPSRKRNSK